MKPTILGVSVLCLAASTALACASRSSAPLSEPTPTAQEKPQAAPQQVRLQSTGGAALEPVYFETDQALLSSASRATLQGMAKAIEQNPEWGVITIQGHCDERGSDEYNLALGERRAAVVKRYLMDLGVAGKRLATVSYGESRPAVRGSDERAWSQNRRSELASKSVQSANR